MLTPDLLAACIGAESHQGAIEEWLVGFFDPVDFIVTDPLGRRLGYTEGLGLLEEIPDAFYTGDGLIEQFMIPNPLPGQYTIELFGLGEDTIAAVGTSLDETGFQGHLAPGETRTLVLTAVPEPSSAFLLLAAMVAVCSCTACRQQRGWLAKRPTSSRRPGLTYLSS